jgi:hypothetical protein
MPCLVAFYQVGLMPVAVMLSATDLIVTPAGDPRRGWDRMMRMIRPVASLGRVAVCHQPPPLPTARRSYLALQTPF